MTTVIQQSCSQQGKRGLRCAMETFFHSGSLPGRAAGSRDGHGWRKPAGRTGVGEAGLLVGC